MSTAEQRAKLAADMLGTLVDAGLSRQEMISMLSFSADVLEKQASQGKTLDTMELDKQSGLFGALAGALPIDAIKDIALRGADKVFGLGERVVGSALDTTMKYSPLIAGAALATPVIAGYAAGHGIGTGSDNGDEMVRSIHQRELVSMLRENARLAEQTRLVEEQRQKQLAGKKRPRRFAG